jgi:hypothetical protein
MLVNSSFDDAAISRLTLRTVRTFDPVKFEITTYRSTVSNNKMLIPQDFRIPDCHLQFYAATYRGDEFKKITFNEMPYSVNESVWNAFMIKFIQLHRNAIINSIKSTKMIKDVLTIVKEYANLTIFDWIDLFHQFIQTSSATDLETAMRCFHPSKKLLGQ